MKTIGITIISAIAILFINIVDVNETISSSVDYEQFLTVDQDNQVVLFEKELNFWKYKLEKSPNQYPYLVKMANAQNELFSCTGDVKYLTDATYCLELAMSQTNCKNTSILRKLAKNYISEHRFDQAYEVLEIAKDNGEQLEETNKMLFDVHMEIGNYDLAENYLQSIKDKNSFDYLIRKSKWYDHNGELDKAIYHMELAYNGVLENKNRELIQWTITNLADYYGHAGKIEKSYNYYLKALEMDPADAYAKKGIAWIVYSYEKNVDEANRIIESIKKYHDSPDYLLLQSEIAEYSRDKVSKQKFVNQYEVKLAAEALYGNMYNKYNVFILADRPESQEVALDIAKKEVNLRPTAQSYSLLAWANYKLGRIDQAKHIVKSEILDKTYEPEPLFVAAKILKAAEDDLNLMLLEEDLVESTYELGPLAGLEIVELQSNISIGMNHFDQVYFR